MSGLKPEFFDNLENNKLVKIYTQLDIKIIALIVDKLLKEQKLDSLSKRQLRILIETGGKEIFEQTLKQMNLMNDKIKKEIKKIYDEMAEENFKSYDDLYKYKQIERKMSKSQIQILNGAIKQTGKDLSNFTKTIAFSAEQLYVNAVDKAYFEVITGGRTVNEALKDAIRELAKQGITLEDKAQRKVSLEVAVRRNLRAGIKQTADNITEEIEKELGCNGYEVVAHVGARPSHAEAQGKQYALTKKDAQKYNVGFWGDVEDLWQEYNCRHTYFGIILGISEPIYTEKELLEMQNKEVTYKGKKIPEYDATQIQRKLEREQRSLLKQIEPLKGKQDVSDLEEKLQLKKTEYKSFCKETGLTPKYGRIEIY